MNSNELKEVLKNFKYFHGFVLDEPIPFKTLFHNINLETVTIVLADDFINWQTNKPDILNLRCGKFYWQNNQITLPEDHIYIPDVNMLVYACNIDADYNKEKQQIVLNATIYVKD